jgi:F-type H+-transporting ATPase subunit b
MEIISKVALITINETFFFQLVSFLIFMFIVTRVMFRPLEQTIRDRNSHFEQLNTDIGDARNELTRLTNQIQEAETRVKEEAFEIRNRMEEEGQLEAQRFLDAASREAAEKKETAMNEISRQIQQARQEIRQEVEGVTTMIMEQLLGRRLI